jgi:hypothetical protein
MAVLGAGARAEDFSWQISGGYGETELTPFADTEHVVLDATYYFEPVDDARGPYALAPFLNRSSRVSAGVTRDKTTIVTPVATLTLPTIFGLPANIELPPPGAPRTHTTTEETGGFQIGGRYVWSATGWYVGASYREADIDEDDISSVFRQGTTIDGYQLFGGRYFGEATSLDLAAGATRQTMELLVSCWSSLCLSGSSQTAIDADDWSIGTLHVRRGARLTYSISGRISSTEVARSVEALQLTLPSGAAPPVPAPGTILGGVSVLPFAAVAGTFTGMLLSPDERETYSIGGELFPTERLGLRIGFARSDGDYAEDDSYDLAATWFFTRAAAVEFALTRTEHETGALRRDVDHAELRLLGRL